MNSSECICLLFLITAHVTVHGAWSQWPFRISSVENFRSLVLASLGSPHRYICIRMLTEDSHHEWNSLRTFWPLFLVCVPMFVYNSRSESTLRSTLLSQQPRSNGILSCGDLWIAHDVCIFDTWGDRVHLNHCTHFAFDDSPILARVQLKSGTFGKIH